MDLGRGRTPVPRTATTCRLQSLTNCWNRPPMASLCRGWQRPLNPTRLSMNGPSHFAKVFPSTTARLLTPTPLSICCPFSVRVPVVLRQSLAPGWPTLKRSTNSPLSTSWLRATCRSPPSWSGTASEWSLILKPQRPTRLALTRLRWELAPSSS